MIGLLVQLLADKSPLDECHCLEINWLPNMMPQSFSDNSTRVAHVVVIAIFSFFAVLALILRLWARKIQRVALELSDYLLVLGLVWTALDGALRRHTDVE